MIRKSCSDSIIMHLVNCYNPHPHMSFSISLILVLVCVCVCLSVCHPCDLGNEMLYRHTSFASLKRFSWRVAQTAFQAYVTRSSREKMFGTYQQVTRWSPCTQVTLLSYPRQDESCPPLKYCWNILERHGYHS